MAKNFWLCPYVTDDERNTKRQIKKTDHPLDPKGRHLKAQTRNKHDKKTQEKRRTTNMRHETGSKTESRTTNS